MARTKPDIQILVGSEVTQSTNQIRIELESAFKKNALQIEAKLSSNALQTIQKQLNSLSLSGIGAGDSGAGFKKGRTSSTSAELDISRQLEQSFARIAALSKKTERTDALKQADSINKGLEQEYQIRLKNESVVKRIAEQEYIEYNNQQSRLAQARMYENIDKSTKGDLKADKNYQDLKRYYTELEKVSAKEAELAAKTAERAQKQSEAMNKLTHQVVANATSKKASFNQYLQTLNPKALEEYSGEIKNIFKEFDSGMSGSQESLNNAGNSVKIFRANMKDLGYEGANVFTYLHSKLKTFMVYLASSAITMGVVGGLRNAIKVIHDLDEALVDLQIVTGQNRESAEGLIQTYNNMAQALGSTTRAVAASANDWLRQGYSVEETNKLIENSMVLSIVGDMKGDDATSALTAALKGYRLEIEEVIGVVDKFTSVDMAAATSAEKLAVALSKTAANAKLSGLSLDSVIAQLAVVNETMSEMGENTGGEMCLVA